MQSYLWGWKNLQGIIKIANYQLSTWLVVSHLKMFVSVTGLQDEINRH